MMVDIYQTSSEQDELLEFWTGNPSNDIWHGHLLLQPFTNEQLSQRAKLSKYICCPVVPTHTHIVEFCQFLEPFQKSISKLRVFKGPEPNFYIVVLVLTSEKDALEFVLNYHTKKFNQIENEHCLLYQIAGARIKSQKQPNSSSSDESSPKCTEECEQIDTCLTHSLSSKYHKSHHSIRELRSKMKSPDALFDLENEQNNCPICLESLYGTSPQPAIIVSPRQTNTSQQQQLMLRMKSEKIRGGENDFNLTILCCHTFHWKCLKNWNDTTCPLCRYLQCPIESSQCNVCGANENLWVCLICGLIGCFNVQAFQNRNIEPGQQSQENGEFIVLQGHGHSLDHYNQTKHVYAMEVYTQNVWDFCKENFVYRLIQNQIDGKLVEFPDPDVLQPDEDQTLDDSTSYFPQSDQSSQVLSQISSEHVSQQQPGNNTLLPRYPRQSSNQRLYHTRLSSSSTLQHNGKETTLYSVQGYNKKVENLNHEINSFLANSLDSQRVYFESRLLDIDREEEQDIQSQKQQINDAEDALRNTDDLVHDLSLQLEKERQNHDDLRNQYAQCLTEVFNIEQENQKLKLINEQQTKGIDEELSELRQQIEQCDNQIAEIKMERQDLVSHIKMSQKIKKSKNAAEIAQGQTLIFETGAPKKGGRASKK